MRDLNLCSRAGYACVCIFEEFEPAWDSLTYFRKVHLMDAAYVAIGGQGNSLAAFNSQLKNDLFVRVVKDIAESLGLTLKSFGES